MSTFTKILVVILVNNIIDRRHKSGNGRDGSRWGPLCSTAAQREGPGLIVSAGAGLNSLVPAPGGEDRRAAVVRRPADRSWPLRQARDLQPPQRGPRQVSHHGNHGIKVPSSYKNTHWMDSHPSRIWKTLLRGPLRVSMWSERLRFTPRSTGGFAWRPRWSRSAPSWASPRRCSSSAATWTRSRPGSARSCRRPPTSPTRTPPTSRYTRSVSLAASC